jgi:hypothetical protein
MFSWIRTRLTFANIVVTFALLFAISGGAYAAGRYVITSTKQISPKVLKSLKGANGQNGAAGPAGPTGPTGPTGAAGVGAAGAQGSPGPGGAPGNEGKEGKSGKEGSPWTAGGTLPKGSSETGVWGLSEPPETAKIRIPIAFTIPLKEPLDKDHVHIFEGTASPTGCSGTEFDGKLINLKAEPGNLCVYIDFQANLQAADLRPRNLEAALSEQTGAGRTGTVLVSAFEEVEVGTVAEGEWVVTAP